MISYAGFPIAHVFFNLNYLEIWPTETALDSGNLVLQKNNISRSKAHIAKLQKAVESLFNTDIVE